MKFCSEVSNFATLARTKVMARNFWLLVGFFCLKVLVVAESCSSFAFWRRDPHHNFNSDHYHFSDKTPYHYNAKTVLATPEGCTPVHLNMLLRHGSRYPSLYHRRKIEDVVEEINRFFPINSTFRYKNLTLPWEMPSDFKEAANKELARSGKREMYEIAKRYAAKFPDVLGHPYSNNSYSFVSTDTLRTSQSALAFAQGLFEGAGHSGAKKKHQPIAVKCSGPQDRDRVLRFYDVCPRYKKLAKASQVRHYSRFLKGPEMSVVAKNIERKLNLTGKLQLSSNAVVELFLMCAFETQTSAREGQWCSVFEEEDLKVLEFLFDLKIYWARGYGQKINYRMSCPLLVDITETMQHFTKERKPFGVFRFAHTGTVIPLLAMLGLFKDPEPLLAETFRFHRHRKFRVADIVPMSGNVAFVLYDCADARKNGSVQDGCRESPDAPVVKFKRGCTQKKAGKSDDVQTGCGDESSPKKAGKFRGYKVQILVNETPVTTPACRGKAVCDLSEFLGFYAHYTSRCDFGAICRKAPKG